MSNPNDLRISRKLRDLAERTAALAERELGEEVGITLMIHPFAPEGSAPGSEPAREFQYISTLPRDHMQECLKALLKKWNAGMPDIAYHEKQ